MNILITGGAGFIGSHLTARLLRDGHSVTVIDSLLTGSEDNLADLTDDPHLVFMKADVVELAIDHAPPGLPGHVDRIYHLASPASPNQHSPISYHALPMETMLVNTIGTLQMLKIAQHLGARLLFASTSEIYGDPEVHPQPETYNGNVSTTGPRSVYDEAKRFGETLVAYFVRDYQLDARIARIFNTYGPHFRADDMRMTDNFIRQALTGETITVYGDGSQTRSLCYVDDTVEGLIKLMEHPDIPGRVVNIGSQDEHTVLEYAQMIQRLTGSSSEIRYTEHLPEHDPHRRQADISLARELLGWSPKVTLEEGMRRTIEYVRSAIMPQQDVEGAKDASDVTRLASV